MTMKTAEWILACKDHDKEEFLIELGNLVDSLIQHPGSGYDITRGVHDWESKVAGWYFPHIEETSRVPDEDEILAHNPTMGDE
jgi:hypothetical protein